MAPTRAELRRSLRAARRGLGSEEQLAAAEAVAESLSDWLRELNPGIAAAYVATDGELSPHPTVAYLRRHGWAIAYPRISGDAMIFCAVENDDQLVPADFGLMEPAPGTTAIAAATLDIVLTPLVGFDPTGSRLGRGRAFYDRAFAFLSGADRPGRPLLVGLAHDLQLVGDLQDGPHDVPLDAVVTPTEIHGRLPR